MLPSCASREARSEAVSSEKSDAVSVTRTPPPSPSDVDAGPEGGLASAARRAECTRAYSMLPGRTGTLPTIVRGSRGGESVPTLGRRRAGASRGHGQRAYFLQD